MTDEVYAYIQSVEKRFDALRSADRRSHDDLGKRLDKASEEFDAFILVYRIELRRAEEDRRNVVDALTRATETVRAQIIEERGDYLTMESYSQQHQAVVQQIDSVERWQYKLVGGLVFATFVAPLVTGALVYMFTKGLL